MPITKDSPQASEELGRVGSWSVAGEANFGGVVGASCMQARRLIRIADVRSARTEPPSAPGFECDEHSDVLRFGRQFTASRAEGKTIVRGRGLIVEPALRRDELRHAAQPGASSAGFELTVDREQSAEPIRTPGVLVMPGSDQGFDVVQRRLGALDPSLAFTRRKRPEEAGPGSKRVVGDGHHVGRKRRTDPRPQRAASRGRDPIPRSPPPPDAFPCCGKPVTAMQTAHQGVDRPGAAAPLRRRRPAHMRANVVRADRTELPDQSEHETLQLA